MSAKDIRNIVLLGHGGSGKTTLAESMLFMTGGTDRFGKVTDGNTTCDYDAEEIKRNISISLAVAPVKYKNVKINVLDTPGNFDFAGEVLSGIRAAECAVLVCGAKDGLSVGAERAWKMLGNKPRMIFINRTDEENSDYNACFDALKGKFGTAIAPIVATKADANKAVTVIVDLLHNKAYDAKGECAIPGDMADEVEALRAELMEAAAGADVSRGFFAHTLGTELGTGWVRPDGSIPEIPLEVYNFIIDLGSFPQKQYDANDVRSINNFNTLLPGTLQTGHCSGGVSPS
mgnify:CR=1 FL=1